MQDVESTVARPVRELKGFAKVSLAAGSSETVSIELDQRAFSFWSVQQGGWAVEAGDFVIGVGSNSRDLPLTQTITVEAPRLAGPLSRDSTLHEWMADPIGRQLIEREVANGQPAAALDEELLHVIGTMPMSTLANFGGMSLDHDALDRIAAAVAARTRNPLEPDWKHQAMSVCVAVTDSKEGQAALEAAAKEAVQLNVALVAVNLTGSDLDTSAITPELSCEVVVPSSPSSLDEVEQVLQVIGGPARDHPARRGRAQALRSRQGSSRQHPPTPHPRGSIPVLPSSITPRFDGQPEYGRLELCRERLLLRHRHSARRRA